VDNWFGGAAKRLYRNKNVGWFICGEHSSVKRGDFCEYARIAIQTTSPR
jgi:hypothetical protein